MSLRFFVNVILVIFAIITIVCSCNTEAEEEDRKLVSSRKLQNLHDNVREEMQGRSLKESVEIRERKSDVEATDTNEYYFVNPINRCSQRSTSLDTFFIGPEDFEQKNVTGNCGSAESYSKVYTSMLKPTKVDTKNLNKYHLMVRGLSAFEASELIINVTSLCSDPPTFLYGSDLRCRYNFQNDPFLRIAPVKEEIISSDPKITIFRQVLYDSEMKKLIEEGKSRIFGNERMNEIHAEDRRRGLAFFRDDDDFVEINTISRRTRDISGRHENFVQPWQITFYKSGGYYPVHSDLNHINVEEVEKYGRRMATVSFILNNAEMGGTTIFPSINLRVEPNEGDAVMWYNVRKDGHEDLRVRHAVCPVVRGNRWEFIKRINEKRMRMKRAT